MRYSRSFVAGAVSVTAVSIVWRFVPLKLHPATSVLAIVESAVVVFVGALIADAIKFRGEANVEKE